MPVDTKRITGPEVTQSLYSFLVPKKTSPILTENELRKDGRSSSDLRPVYLKLGVISQAKGSAYIELNQTKAICSVYGPREIPRRQEFTVKGVLHCEVKLAPFSSTERRSPQNEDKDLSSVLQQALEPAVCLHKFPKARVDVYCVILDDGGSALAAAITCAGAALADAGIELYDLVIGCNSKQLGNKMLMDPTKIEELHEEDDENGTVTLAFMPNKQQISALLQTGKLDHQTLTQAVKKLIDGCHRLYASVKQCLVESIQKHLRDTNDE